MADGVVVDPLGIGDCHIAFEPGGVFGFGPDRRALVVVLADLAGERPFRQCLDKGIGMVQPGSHQFQMLRRQCAGFRLVEQLAQRFKLLFFGNQRLQVFGRIRRRHDQVAQAGRRGKDLDFRGAGIVVAIIATEL